VEEHHQDVVLVLGRVDGATEGIASLPQDGVDLVLGDGGGAGVVIDGHRGSYFTFDI
jgi:hypothetical protein